MFSGLKKAKVLAFGAHPDDIEIGCGGTLLKLLSLGHEIHHAVLTKGEEGSLIVAKDELVKIRKAEAIDASKKMGAKDIHFFNYSDGLTSFTKEMKIEVIHHIRKIKPDVVFIHAKNDNQPDHQIIHKLVVDAIAAASGPWFPEAMSKPHQTKLVLGYEVWSPISTPQFIVDISKFLTQKLDIINLYKSQVSDVDYATAIEGLAKYRALINKDNVASEVFEIIYSQEF